MTNTSHIPVEDQGRLTLRVRVGYSLGSLSTGSFGTVPGLLLLPYLTDSLGVAASAAGLLVLLPKAWDVVFNPIAGRISDRTKGPLGARRPYLIYGGIALAILFAMLISGAGAPALRDAVGGLAGYRIMGIAVGVLILFGAIAAFIGTARTRVVPPL